MRFGLLASFVCFSIAVTNWPARIAVGSVLITPLAVHAHRYQDFQKNAVACEVFGEIKNTGDQPVKSFTLNLEMIDSKGKVVSRESMTLPLRVIAPGNAKGELRPVRPHEIGNFIQDTKYCPDQWLEGKIKYRITEVQAE